MTTVMQCRLQWWWGKFVQWRVHRWWNKFWGPDALSPYKLFLWFGGCHARRPGNGKRTWSNQYRSTIFCSQLYWWDEFEYDEFKDFEKRIIKFEQDLKIYELHSKDSFFYAVLYGIYYSMLEEKENFGFCQDKEKPVEVFGRLFRQPPDQIRTVAARPEPFHLWSNLSCM